MEYPPVLFRAGYTCIRAVHDLSPLQHIVFCNAPIRRTSVYLLLAGTGVLLLPLHQGPGIGLYFSEFSFYCATAIIAVRLTIRVGSGTSIAIYLLANTLHRSLKLLDSPLHLIGVAALDG